MYRISAALEGSVTDVVATEPREARLKIWAKFRLCRWMHCLFLSFTKKHNFIHILKSCFDLWYSRRSCFSNLRFFCLSLLRAPFAFKIWELVAHACDDVIVLSFLCVCCYLLQDLIKRTVASAPFWGSFSTRDFCVIGEVWCAGIIFPGYTTQNWLVIMLFSRHNTHTPKRQSRKQNGGAYCTFYLIIMIRKAKPFFRR